MSDMMDALLAAQTALPEIEKLEKTAASLRSSDSLEWKIVVSRSTKVQATVLLDEDTAPKIAEFLFEEAQRRRREHPMLMVDLNGSRVEIVEKAPDEE